MFEHHRQQLLPRRAFLFRLMRFTGAALLLVAGSWGVGILGYRTLEGMSWIDATLNAAMILGGMGPVDPLRTDAGKLFASFYALFSGIVFLVSVGVLIRMITRAPVLFVTSDSFRDSRFERRRGGDRQRQHNRMERGRMQNRRME